MLDTEFGLPAGGEATATVASAAPPAAVAWNAPGFMVQFGVFLRRVQHVFVSVVAPVNWNSNAPVSATAHQPNHFFAPSSAAASNNAAFPSGAWAQMGLK